MFYTWVDSTLWSGGFSGVPVYDSWGGGFSRSVSSGTGPWIRGGGEVGGVGVCVCVVLEAIRHKILYSY